MTTADYEITSGGARAVITRIGAGLRAFEVAGVPYLETFPEGEHPPLGAGTVLVPWPNRINKGVWHWDGTEQRVPINEPERGHAIHGLVRDHVWEVVQQSTNRIMLATDIPVQEGWPVALHTTIDYALDERGLSVTHGGAQHRRRPGALRRRHPPVPEGGQRGPPGLPAPAVREHRAPAGPGHVDANRARPCRSRAPTTTSANLVRWSASTSTSRSANASPARTA